MAFKTGPDSPVVLKSSLLGAELPNREDRPPDMLEKAARPRPGARRPCQAAPGGAPTLPNRSSPRASEAQAGGPSPVVKRLGEGQAPS